MKSILPCFLLCYPYPDYRNPIYFLKSENYSLIYQKDIFLLVVLQVAYESSHGNSLLIITKKEIWLSCLWREEMPLQNYARDNQSGNGGKEQDEKYFESV